MAKRVLFTVPDEPPPKIVAASTVPEAQFTETLHQAMYEYFISCKRPQTAMLPRNLVSRTIEDAIASLCQTMLIFPIFELDRDLKKFVRCCYRSVWRTLLGEWQARLLFALGKTPPQARLPRGFKPFIQLPP